MKTIELKTSQAFLATTCLVVDQTDILLAVDSLLFLFKGRLLTLNGTLKKLGAV
jgi:hypothetical protein